MVDQAAMIVAVELWQQVEVGARSLAECENVSKTFTCAKNSKVPSKMGLEHC